MIDLVATGRRPSELAKEFGCHETSILSWMRGARVTDAAAPIVTHQSASLNAADLQELIELRRKLRQVQQERDILAKACDHGLQAKASRRPQRLRADCCRHCPHRRGAWKFVHSLRFSKFEVRYGSQLRFSQDQL